MEKVFLSVSSSLILLTTHQIYFTVGGYRSFEWVIGLFLGVFPLLIGNIIKPLRSNFFPCRGYHIPLWPLNYVTTSDSIVYINFHCSEHRSRQNVKPLTGEVCNTDNLARNFLEPLDFGVYVDVIFVCSRTSRPPPPALEAVWPSRTMSWSRYCHKNILGLAWVTKQKVQAVDLASKFHRS